MLASANLQQVNLAGCSLTSANVSCANFQHKERMLEQSLSAQNWQEAIDDPEFLMQLEVHHRT